MRVKYNTFMFWFLVLFRINSLGCVIIPVKLAYTSYGEVATPSLQSRKIIKICKSKEDEFYCVLTWVKMTHRNDTRKYPVMIMHGLLGSKSNWHSMSKSLHDRLGSNIISVDARNHGDSPQTPEINYPSLAEDIKLLMTDLGISKIKAIGHSLGGRSMMHLALEYPHLVKSLVIVDVSPVRTPRAILDLTSLLDAMAAVKFENNIPISKARKMVDEQLKGAIPNMSVRQFLLTNLAETEDGRYKWRINLNSIIHNFSSIAHFEPPNKKFEGPALFIGGRKSTFLREEDHEGIRNYFPNAEFQYIEGAGHWLHTEKPAEFLELVCNFFNKT